MSTAEKTAERLEGVVLVLIVICVGGAAGAASFTHVKDWTMANSPAGTHVWFGWANAVISEMVPIAALLTIRRRKRTGGPIGYPLFLLIAAAGLSLSAQLAVAKPGISGWLLSAVPALAFMALVKLVLAPTAGTASATPQPVLITTDTTPVKATDPVDTYPTALAPAVEPEPAPVNPEPARIEPVGQPEPVHVDPEPAHQPRPAPPVPVVSEPVTPEPVIQEPADLPEPPAHLIPTARFVIVNHEQHTGAPITTDELADRLGTTPPIAAALINAINPPAVRVNGNTPALGGAR